MARSVVTKSFRPSSFTRLGRRTCSGGLLLATCCLLLLSFPAQAQSLPQPSSPLYGGRPENGPVATGLPKALKDVGIDQKLNEQFALALVVRDAQGNTGTPGQYFGKRPAAPPLGFYYY